MSALLQAALLILTVGVIFVNGWTDAPGAITTAVTTGAVSYKNAVKLAAFCNLLGILVMSAVSSSVADTMVSMARFDGARPAQSVAALCAAMLTIVVFAVSAWAFGIPTSESHALIAAMTGAAVAMGGAAGTDPAAWGKVLQGLVISMGMGFLLGFLLTGLLSPALRRCKDPTLDKLQIAAAGGTAFMHGAQDGQKFIAVLVIVDLLAKGRYHPGPVDIRQHWLALLLCAVVMALGTAVGGKRIVEAVGEKMAPLKKHQGVCADLAGGLCLLAASLSGIPMSTTHTKTTAIMGAGLRGNRGSMDFGIMGSMVLAWLITFPVCGVLGYLFTKLFLLWL